MKDLLFPLLIKGAIWIIGASQVYIIALAFSIDVPYFSFVLMSITSVVVASILPISVGGLGVREGVLVVLLSTFGVQPETAFVISLGGYMIKTLFPGIIGLIISFKKTHEL